MAQFVQLVKRNIYIYLRDKGAVFFSLLSMLVIICLMIFFLGDLNVNSLTNHLAVLDNRNAAEDEKNALLFVLTWTAAGIIPVNAFMVTLSALSSMIKDKTSEKSDSIYTSPIKRITIAAAYITAACISSIIICILTYVISELYLYIKGGALFTLEEHLQIFGLIIINSFAYSAIMYLLALLIKSDSAWNAMGTVLGTLVGFLGGIYIPIGTLAAGLQNVIKFTPFIYSTVLFRKVMTESISDKIFFGVPDEIVNVYKETMGINIELFSKDISLIFCAAIIITCGIIFLTIGALLTSRKKGVK